MIIIIIIIIGKKAISEPWTSSEDSATFVVRFSLLRISQQ
jgi:hypothetical protein